MSGLYFKLFQTFLSKHPKKGINVDIRKWENLETVRAWAGKEFPDIGHFRREFSSVQFSRSVVSDSLRPHESQHARPPFPSPTPGVHWDSCPSSQWCHPAISSSVRTEIKWALQAQWADLLTDKVSWRFCGLVVNLTIKKIPAGRLALGDWLGCYRVITGVAIFA